jgi:hypothetical protein
LSWHEKLFITTLASCKVTIFIVAFSTADTTNNARAGEHLLLRGGGDSICSIRRVCVKLELPSWFQFIRFLHSFRLNPNKLIHD